MRTWEIIDFCKEHNVVLRLKGFQEKNIFIHEISEEIFPILVDGYLDCVASSYKVACERAKEIIENQKSQ